MSYANRILEKYQSLSEKKEVSPIEQELIDDLQGCLNKYDMKNSTSEYIENIVIPSGGSFSSKPPKKEIVDKNGIHWLFKKKRDGSLYVYEIFLLNGKNKLDTFHQTM